MADPFILDTNILVHFVRGSRTWTKIRDRYQLLLVEPRPFISVVTAGELRSLAYQRFWETAKRNLMEFILGYFKTVTIDDPAVIEAYAIMDAHLERIGQTLGKNDMWIAATVQVLGSRLLTTDRDFDRLHPLFIERDWIDPNDP